MAGHLSTYCHFISRTVINNVVDTLMMQQLLSLLPLHWAMLLLGWSSFKLTDQKRQFGFREYEVGICTKYELFQISKVYTNRLYCPELFVSDPMWFVIHTITAALAVLLASRYKTFTSSNHPGIIRSKWVENSTRSLTQQINCRDGGWRTFLCIHRRWP